MTRSLHFEPGWSFLHSAVRTIYQRLPRMEQKGQIFTFYCAKGPDLDMLSLGGHFYIAPYEQFISGLPSVEGAKWPDLCIFEPGWPFFALRRMNSLSVAGQRRGSEQGWDG